MIEHLARADIGEVAEHHHDDDAEDEHRLAGVRHPCLVLVDAQVEEIDGAQDHQGGDDLLEEVVDVTQRHHPEQRQIHAFGPEDPEVEVRIEAPPPQHERVEQQDDEADEDDPVGHPRALVVVHLLLPEGVDVGALQALEEVVEPVDVAADLHQLPATVRGPAEGREEAEQHRQHPSGVHRVWVLGGRVEDVNVPSARFSWGLPRRDGA